MKITLMLSKTSFQREFLKFVLLLSLTIGSINLIEAQTITAGINASSLANGNRNIGVDFATGLMNYNIPLINLNQGSKKVEVGISYSARGIKVEQQASVVGLGWSLTGTGVVTRTIRGLEDEVETYGSLHYPIPANPIAFATYKEKVNKREIDGESDLFSLSYAGLNVKFVLEKITNSYLYKAIPLVKTNVKIEVEQLLPDNSPTWQIMGFRVTDESGDVYIFRDQEVLLAYFKQEATGVQSYLEGRPNAWYLTEIHSYNGERVKFEYQDDFLSENKLIAGAQMHMYGKRWVNYGANDSIKTLINAKMTELELEQERIVNVNKTLNFIKESINNIENELYLLDNASIRSVWDSTRSVLNTYRDPNLGSIIEDRIQFSLTGLISKFNLLKDAHASSPQFDAIEYQLDLLVNSYWNTPVNTSAVEYPILNISGTKVKLLKRIKLRNSEVLFNYRLVSVGDQSKMFLEEIKLLNFDSSPDRRISFEHSDQLALNSKEYLKSVKIKGGQSDLNPMIYRFEYFNESDYLYESNQDFWGYPNGGGSLPGLNQSLLPVEWKWANYSFNHPVEDYRWIEEVFGSYASVLGSGAYDWEMTQGFVGGSRSPIAAEAIKRSLKKVTLPEGGNIQFEYELNTINSRFQEHSYGTPTSSPKVLPVGGLRIKKVTESDGTGKSYAKKYKYEFLPGGGSTIPLSSGFNVKQDRQSFSVNVDYGPSMLKDIILSSLPYDFSFQLEEAGNENVFYSYVEEIVDGIGRTGYKYLKFDQALSDKYPYWLERLLLAKTSYDELGNIKSLERFKYQVASADLYNYMSSEYLGSRFVQLNQYPFQLFKSQYKAFPHKDYDQSVASSFPTTSPVPNYTPYDQYYLVNIEPRTHQINEPLQYQLALGGSVLLSEVESFTFPSNGIGSNLIPSMTAGNAAHEYNWLFGLDYSHFLSSKQRYYYDNSEHTFVNRIESFNSAGQRTLVKYKYNSDYSNTAGSVIAELRTANIWNAKIEQQNWAYSTSDSEWKFIGGQLNNYGPIILNPNVSPTTSRYLPSSSFVSQLEQPVSVGSNGWNESVFSVPPYALIPHENGQVYVDKTASFQWTANVWGISLEGQGKRNNLVNQGVINDFITGYPRLTVSSASRDEIALLDFNQTANQDYTAVKKPISSIGTGFGFASYDNLGYLETIAHSIKSMSMSDYANAFQFPLFKQIDSLVIYLANPQEYSRFYGLSLGLWPLYYNTSSTDFELIQSYCQPYFDFSILVNQLLPFTAADDGTITKLFRNRQYVVTESGAQEVKLMLNTYKTNGKRIQLTSLSPFNISYNVNYSDGTASATRTISNSGLKNGFHVGYIDLSTITNYSNATDFSYAVTYLASSPATIWIVPEDAQYEYSQYINDKPNLKLNHFGDRFNYFYDDMNRLINVTDKDGHILKQFKYNFSTAIN